MINRVTQRSYKRFLVDKKGKTNTLILLALFGVLLYIVLAILVPLKNQLLNKFFAKTPAHAAQTMSDKTLFALGLHALSKDEFAVIQRSTGKHTGKMTKQSFMLHNGQTYSFDTDQNTTVSVLEGNENSVQYVKISDDVGIHNVNELTSQAVSNAKVDPDISKKLKNKDQTVAVIIYLNLPFGKFYEKNQSVDKIKDKKDKFENAKKNIASLLSKNGKIKRDLQVINGISADIDQETLQSLSKSADVKQVELDKVAKVFLDVSVGQIQASSVWNLTDANGQPLTGVGEKIAVIDTGVDYAHPDLGGCFGSSCKVIGGYNYINNNANPMDDNGHGTHVAATAAGKGLLNGVAPDAKILAYKVCDSGGSCPYSAILAGINAAVDPNSDGNPTDHADVGTMSLGGSGNPDDTLSIAVDNATTTGIVFTIAAGNSGPSSSTVQSPGTARTAITVAASCKTADVGVNSYCSNPIASFSSRGPLIWNGVDMQKPDIAAPGVMICAAHWDSSFSYAPTCFDAQHIRISGTSMATPHIAGAAALVRQAFPGYTPDQVKQALKSTARSLGMTYNDQGAGEVNVKAAIPISPKLNNVPSSWTIATDPTHKLSVHTQTFSVTSTDPTISSLTVGLGTTISGVSMTQSKQTLQVANGATDTFDATFTVDNDVAKAGTNVVNITLVDSSGVTKGIIPVFLTIKPTLTATPNTSIDYGIDDPSLSNWISNTQTISITNLRTDVAQTINTSSSSFASGITLQMPSSVTVAASSSSTMDTKFVADNTQVANDVYTGTITLSNTANAFTLSTKFTKFYVLTVQDNNSADLAKTFPVVVHNRNGKSYTDYSSTSPKIFYLNDPGTYDVIVHYLFFYNPALGHYADYTVLKEGISVTGGSTTVTTSKSEATNFVKVYPTDINGSVGQVMEKERRLVFGPTSQAVLAIMTFSTDPNYYKDYFTEQFFNTVSTNYTFTLLDPSVQPASTVYYWQGTFTGLNGNLSFTNTPSDLNKMNVNWNIDQQSGNILPLIFHGWNGTGNVTYFQIFLPIPVQTTIYSAIKDNSYEFMVWYDNQAGQIIESNSPYFTAGTDLKRWSIIQHQPLPDLTERNIYYGLGPSFWDGKFNISSNSVVLWSYHDRGALLANYPALLRQDYAIKSYAQTPLTFYKNGNLYSTTFFPAYPGGTQPSGWFISIDPGSYEMRADFPYKIQTLDMTGKVRAIFDSTKADPNPPAFKRLYFYSGANRSEQYDPTVVNRVDFELDPVGGNMKQVQANYSKDGTTFMPLTVTNTSGVYSANVTPVSGIAKVTVKISATDDSGNNLTYSFELPVGPGTAIVDTQAPTVSITSPSDGATVTGTVSVTTDARDNFGVSKGELYVDNGLQSSSTTDPFTFTLDTKQLSYGQHTLVAKAYDEAGNAASSSPVTISIPAPTPSPSPSPTPSLSPSPSPSPSLSPSSSPKPSLSPSPSPTPIDTTPPSVGITNPLNGSTVARKSTVTISANVTDNKGVAKVEFSVNNVLTCSSTVSVSPYSCKWSVPNKPNTAYTVLVKGYDTAGNTASQSIQVTAK